MFTHARFFQHNVTAYLSDGRSCTWAVFTEAQAEELAGIINRGVAVPADPGDSRPGDFLGQPRRPIRLVPRYDDDFDHRSGHHVLTGAKVFSRADLQPPVPADDWLRLRASSMAKEAAAFASGEQPDTGRREPVEKPGLLDRAIRWLAGA